MLFISVLSRITKTMVRLHRRWTRTHTHTQLAHLMEKLCNELLTDIHFIEVVYGRDCLHLPISHYYVTGNWKSFRFSSVWMTEFKIGLYFCNAINNQIKNRNTTEEVLLWIVTANSKIFILMRKSFLQLHAAGYRMQDAAN